MASGVSAKLSDEQFVHAYIGDFLDGDLNADEAKRMETLMKKPENEGLEASFKNLRGRLQLSLQSYYLREDEIVRLKALVEDPSIRATHEAEKIEQIERKEFSGNLQRRLVLIGAILALVIVLAWIFAPPPKVQFEPLANLGYEALALEEDPEERLDLPTNDMAEIKNYFDRYPGLSFEPEYLTLGDEWFPEGAAMIDYEVAKVATTYWTRKADRSGLVHFSFAGQLGDLPKSDQGNRGGFIYQTYASDQMNIIAWQHAPGVVSMLAGHGDALSLADLAKTGAKKN